MLDFVKRFKSEEFDNKLKSYHDRALHAFIQLGILDSSIDWDNLRFTLTHDVRQADPIAVIDTSSEFQFLQRRVGLPAAHLFSMESATWASS